jgi:outer membrane protein assembly factor BamB
VPDKFDRNHGLKWRTEIAGKGWSSPVVSHGKVWLTTAITREATEAEKADQLARQVTKDVKEIAGMVQLRAICIDFATGEILKDVMLGEFAEIGCSCCRTRAKLLSFKPGKNSFNWHGTN